MAKTLNDRKMAKTISLKGSTILKLDDISSKMNGVNHSAVIENLIEKEYSTLFSGTEGNKE